MASNKPKVEDTGYLFLADPNPPGREFPPLEDLFIYVNLKYNLLLVNTFHHLHHYLFLNDDCYNISKIHTD